MPVIDVPDVMHVLKGMRFRKEVILVCIRWYAAYPLSYSNREEMMQERGVSVDHSTVNRWSIKFLPVLEKIFRTACTVLAGIELMHMILSIGKIKRHFPKIKIHDASCFPY
jgi:transposase-like protein